MPAFYSCKNRGSERRSNLLKGTQFERGRTLEPDFKAPFLRYLGKLGKEIRGRHSTRIL